MLSLQRILCPIDFSGPSVDALKVASELALRFSSELFVVHVISPIIPPLAPEGIPYTFDIQQYEQDLRAYYGQLLPGVVNKNVPKEIAVQSFILHGDVAHEIARFSRENNVGLIVVAPHSHSDLRRLFFGSLAQKITRLAPCQVLTLPFQVEEKGEEAFTREPPPGTKLDKKRVYQEKIENQLKEWGAKIDELKAKADKSKAEVKSKFEQQIAELREKQEKAKQKLHEVRVSSDEAWEDLKTGLEKVMEDLRQTIGRAMSRFKKEKE